MNVLVDTHYLIWSLVEPERIRPEAVEILEDADYVKLVSVVSFWEIALKYSLGKLDLRNITPQGLLETATDSGYHVLPVDPEDAASSYQLVRSPDHKDLFDRLLVWQCIRNELTMLTSDSRMEAYGEQGLKLF